MHHLDKGCPRQDDLASQPKAIRRFGEFRAEGIIMSTDKLQAVHDTVAEILSEPPSSPHTYFDDEPPDVAHVSEQGATAAPAGEQGATAADYLQRATQIPTGTFNSILTQSGLTKDDFEK